MADKFTEDKLRDRLSNYEDEPAFDAWEQLEDELPSSGSSYRPIWIAAGILLLMGIGFSVRYVLTSDVVSENHNQELISSNSAENDQLSSQEVTQEILDVESHENELKSNQANFEPNNVDIENHQVENYNVNEVSTKTDDYKSASVSDLVDNGNFNSDEAKSSDQASINNALSIELDVQAKASELATNTLVKSDQKEKENELEFNSHKKPLINTSENLTDEIGQSTAAYKKQMPRINGELDSVSDSAYDDEESKEEVIDISSSEDKHEFLAASRMAEQNNSVPYLLERKGYNLTNISLDKVLISDVAVGTPALKDVRDDEEKGKKTSRKGSLYFQAMPTLTYNRVEANREDVLLVRSVKKLPALSSERIGIRLETGFLYPLTERFNVFGGLLYFQRDQTINYSIEVLEGNKSVSRPEGLFIEPIYKTEDEEYDFSVKNIGTQVGVSYQIKSNKFNTSIGAGMELHKSLVKQQTEFEEPDFYVFSNVFYRLEYPKDKNFRFMAQPTFNYSLDINRNLNTPFHVKPYGFGLNFGFTMKF